MARIVVGVDGSAHADDALRWAVQEALVRCAEVELVLAYSARFHRQAAADANRQLAAQTMERVVGRNRAALERIPWTSTLAPLRSAPAAHALIDAGDEADLVVIGSRGLGGFGALLLGSTSYATAGHAPCPVAVVRDGAHGDVTRRPRRIVVGIDDSRVARRALRWAVDEAELRAVPVTVVHGCTLPTVHLLGGLESQQHMERARADALDQAGRVVDRALEIVDIPPVVHVERVVTVGSAAGLLLDVAGEEALLVVGTRRRGVVGRMVLGSVSHQVLHHASCPVIVAP